METMSKVAVREDMEDMRKFVVNKVEATMKVAISEAVDSLKSELHDLKARIEALDGQKNDLGGVGPYKGLNDKMMRSKRRSLNLRLRQLSRPWTNPMQLSGVCGRLPQPTRRKHGLGNQ